MHLRRPSCLPFSMIILLAACDPGSDGGRPGADTRAETTTDTIAEPDTVAPTTPTTLNTTTLDTTTLDTTTLDTTTLDTTTPDTTTPDTTTPDTTDAATTDAATDTSAPDTPLPIGGACTSDHECASGACDVVPFFGGLCSACNDDGDCAGGCTHGSPFADRPAVCADGALGAGCENDDACQPGLLCTTAFDLGGLVALTTCGACRDDDDCPTDARCGARLDLPGFAGYRDCIALGALPAGHPCDYDGGRDALCASAICAAVDVPSFGFVGVCGACHTDGDCPGDATCQPGVLDLTSGATAGSTCE